MFEKICPCDITTKLGNVVFDYTCVCSCVCNLSDNR